jgi:serine/threonine protein kinase/tetratricopeptide (TPR) repeat protein
MAAERTEPQAGGGRSSSAAVSPREQQLEDLLAAMRHSADPRAEDFLARLPDLRDEDAVRIVYEEACLRIERGEASVTSEVLNRFPHWGSQLGLLIECKRLLMDGAQVRFPEVGEQLGDFQILTEIGHGAAGRTFLASQRSLADRLLVLKVTPLGQDEHLSLARLQHMHIVPLYVEQVFPDHLVRILGMPYLGGVSLARLLEVLEGIPVGARTGRHLLDALDHCAPAARPELPALGPFRSYFKQTTFVEAICWIGACVADALQYAHDRGLVHLDVKPSNILIAADGQPMLLDFHLARGPVTAQGPLPDRLGGTPGFVSPEQHEAMESVRAGKPVVRQVDGRSDIFSLGRLLYQALGGQDGEDAAVAPAPPPPLAEFNPGVSTGLSDIVAKCLALDPDERYPDAAGLAADLRRHVADLPLRGVPNRSPIERWRKWRRRSPGALSRRLVGLGLGLLLALAVALGFALIQQRGRQVEAALDEAGRYLSAGHHSESLLALQRGYTLAGQLPAFAPRRQALDALHAQAVRARNVAELHDLVNLFRFRFGVTPPEPAVAQALYRRARAIWDSRGRILKPGPAGSSVSAPASLKSDDQVRLDLIDLATILADLCAHQDSHAVAGMDRAEAVRILSSAEAELGPAAPLRRDLARYAREMGRDDGGSAPIPEPGTAWEHYDLGRSNLRSGDHALALAEFQRAIEMRPEEFWPYFYHGICSYRLGDSRAALASLGTAIALSPLTAECYYNRALAYQALGRNEEAIRDDTRALELDPRFTDAALNRAILMFHAGRHADALADLARARATASGPAALGRIAYNMALVHLARKDQPAARASVREAIEHGDASAQRLADQLGPP